MNFQNIFYPESKFGGFTDIDGTNAFFLRINSLLASSNIVLDVGCGRGSHSGDSIIIRRDLRILKGKVKKIIGIDVDKTAQKNKFLDKFLLFKGNSWPIKSDSIDMVICDNVLEHVPEPDKFFFEANRVLRKGGYLCIRTPNSWSYVALFSKFIPNRYHAKITSIVQKGRKGEDVFPTLYRCNSLGQIRSMMIKYYFDSVVYGYEAEPSYLSFSKIFYWLGVIHQKFSPGFLKPAIFAFGRKLN
jgi:SAM-dependent methyltransferase